MGAAFVVELPPAFDEHLGPSTAAKPFPVQQFVAQLAIEAFDEPVLPRTARRNEGRASPFDARATGFVWVATWSQPPID
jgi:hypothetical protein